MKTDLIHALWGRPFLSRVFFISALLLCMVLSGCDEKTLEQTAHEKVQEFRGMIGLPQKEPGIVATVNGVTISLQEVEALSDMRSVKNSSGITLENLWADYASSLYELIVQELVRQELASHEVSVDPAQAYQVEAMISRSYALEPGTDFDAEIEDNNVTPYYWRRQIFARLEQELWEDILLQVRSFSSSDVENYIKAHPEFLQRPETYDYVLVESLDRDMAEKYRKSGQVDPAALRSMGAVAVSYSRPVEEVPEVWKKDIQQMKAGGISKSVRQNGLAFSYLILLAKSDARERTSMELYNMAQAAMAEEILPQLYDEWLQKALAKSDIRIVRQLLPENVPPRAEGRGFVLPWEKLGQEMEEEALGEVEGEVTEGEQ